MLSRLELALVHRPRIDGPDGLYKSERHYLDFVVDGHSLCKSLVKSSDLVSVFCREFSLTSIRRAIDCLLLLKEADSPHGRCSLFICAECGDFDCGAITAEVIRDSDKIVWRQFGFETNAAVSVSLEEFSGVGPFTFQADCYDKIIRQAIDMVESK